MAIDTKTITTLDDSRSLLRGWGGKTLLNLRSVFIDAQDAMKRFKGTDPQATIAELETLLAKAQSQLETMRDLAAHAKHHNLDFQGWSMPSQTEKP